MAVFRFFFQLSVKVSSLRFVFTEFLFIIWFSSVLQTYNLHLSTVCHVCHTRLPCMVFQLTHLYHSTAYYRHCTSTVKYGHIFFPCFLLLTQFFCWTVRICQSYCSSNGQKSSSTKHIGQFRNRTM